MIDKYWQSKIRALRPGAFEQIAMELFHWQFDNNQLYRAFCELIHHTPAEVSAWHHIPYLPISFFKTHRIQSGDWEPAMTFTSSRTSGTNQSQHSVRSYSWYLESATTSFAAQYGTPAQYAWMALLPGYLERTGSSLIDMAAHFIRRSRHPESGFFLDDFGKLKAQIDRLHFDHKKVVLLGVTHALLQFAKQFPSSWNQDIIVMETGGMKGHGPELVRYEVHQQLQKSLGVDHIHSEYGMTELFSQAYAPKDGLFHPGPAMRVTTREINDPYTFPGYGKTGLLCICDLANYATQAFIATQDLGRVYPDGRFEMLGRLDGSDIRGCNLLVGDV
jgi:hypothetical protein